MSTSSCQEVLRRQFDIYDTTVDVVSCWESFLTDYYSDEFSQFYFDRFPKIEAKNGTDSATPDFTVYFDDNYGMIGEVKRGFGDGDDAFRSDLNQLIKYDCEYELEHSEGGSTVPTECDILLIISGTAAPQIGTRIARILEEEDYIFDNNLILLRYQFNRDAQLSRYEFQRVTQLDYEFRDDPLPPDKRLSSEMGETGEYGTLPVYPKHFGPVKAKKPICNDDPPGQYLATILWNKIFPVYIEDEAYRSWDGKRTINLNISVSDLVDWINDNYLTRGRLRTYWVQGSLDFLAGAELAQETNGDYVVEFRDLVIDVGTTDILQEAMGDYREMKELAYMLINRYCEYTEESDTPSPEQSSIHEF
jgi:hypothetical protein